jgi:dolichol-phosphate mannosyltransferase
MQPTATKQDTSTHNPTRRGPVRLSDLHLAIVTPMANEGEEGVRFVEAALKQTAAFGRVTMFVLIDRATKDNSLELLREYAERDPRLEVIWAPETRGLVDAYITSYKVALESGADWILEIDAGFSHDPADMPKFWQTIEAGYDCAFGTRFSKGGRIEDSSFKRRCISWGGSFLTNSLLGTKLSDMTSGYELFRRDVLQSVMDRGIQSRGHFFQTEIKTYCRKYRGAEVPITYRAASPRMSLKSIQDAFRQLWRLFKLRLARQL